MPLFTTMAAFPASRPSLSVAVQRDARGRVVVQGRLGCVEEAPPRVHTAVEAKADRPTVRVLRVPKRTDLHKARQLSFGRQSTHYKLSLLGAVQSPKEPSDARHTTSPHLVPADAVLQEVEGVHERLEWLAQGGPPRGLELEPRIAL